MASCHGLPFRRLFHVSLEVGLSQYSYNRYDAYGELNYLLITVNQMLSDTSRVKVKSPSPAPSESVRLVIVIRFPKNFVSWLSYGG